MAGIIFLHGASSSGKTTLARALQDRLPDPFWHYSIDHLRDSGVLPSARIARGDFDWRAMRSGFFEGFHRSIAAFADAGNNLIVEHILDTSGWHQTLMGLLRPHRVLFVGVHTPLDELERREAARGDRPPGSAAADYHTIHAGCRYDIEVSGGDAPDENADRLAKAWDKHSGPGGFFEPYTGTGA